MSKIDWTVMWKFFHYQFCWIYLSVGVPMRLFLARGLKGISLGKTSSYAITSSLLASFLSTWFPVIPLAGGAILVNIGGYAASQSTLITVPMVAVLMGLESALVDAVFVRVLLKGSFRVRFKALLVLNTLNSAVALAVGLAWAFGHMPTFIDL
ncbi:MAG: hypothetical protein WAM13_07930 [Candidatus Sulfotelmatobacter sp.]